VENQNVEWAQARATDAAKRIASLSSNNPLLRLPIFMWQVYDYSPAEIVFFTKLMATHKSLSGAEYSIPQKVADCLKSYDGSFESARHLYAEFQNYKIRLESKVKAKYEHRQQKTYARPASERLDGNRLNSSDDIN
jgi:hypothetical protein